MASPDSVWPSAKGSWKRMGAASVPNAKAQAGARGLRLRFRPDSLGFDQGLLSVPSCPASRQMVSRSCRTAARSDVQCQCISQSPQRTPERATIPGVAPARRQSQAVAAASAPNYKRLSGFSVRRDDSQPCRQRAAPKSPSVDRWHQGGTNKFVLQPCRCFAPYCLFTQSCHCARPSPGLEEVTK